MSEFKNINTFYRNERSVVNESMPGTEDVLRGIIPHRYCLPNGDIYLVTPNGKIMYIGDGHDESVEVWDSMKQGLYPCYYNPVSISGGCITNQDISGAVENAAFVYSDSVLMILLNTLDRIDKPSSWTILLREGNIIYQGNIDCRGYKLQQTQQGQDINVYNYGFKQEYQWAKNKDGQYLSTGENREKTWEWVSGSYTEDQSPFSPRPVKCNEYMGHGIDIKDPIVTRGQYTSLFACVECPTGGFCESSSWPNLIDNDSYGAHHTIDGLSFTECVPGVREDGCTIICLPELEYHNEKVDNGLPTGPWMVHLGFDYLLVPLRFNIPKISDFTWIGTVNDASELPGVYLTDDNGNPILNRLNQSALDSYKLQLKNPLTGELWNPTPTFNGDNPITRTGIQVNDVFKCGGGYYRMEYNGWKYHSDWDNWTYRYVIEYMLIPGRADDSKGWPEFLDENGKPKYIVYGGGLTRCSNRFLILTIEPDTLNPSDKGEKWIINLGTSKIFRYPAVDITVHCIGQMLAIESKDGNNTKVEIYGKNFTLLKTYSVPKVTFSEFSVFDETRPVSDELDSLYSIQIKYFQDGNYYVDIIFEDKIATIGLSVYGPVHRNWWPNTEGVYSFEGKYQRYTGFMIEESMCVLFELGEEIYRDTGILRYAFGMLAGVCTGKFLGFTAPRWIIHSYNKWDWDDKHPALTECPYLQPANPYYVDQPGYDYKSGACMENYYSGPCSDGLSLFVKQCEGYECYYGIHVNKKFLYLDFVSGETSVWCDTQYNVVTTGGGVGTHGDNNWYGPIPRFRIPPVKAKITECPKDEFLAALEPYAVDESDIADFVEGDPAAYYYKIAGQNNYPSMLNDDIDIPNTEIWMAIYPFYETSNSFDAQFTETFYRFYALNTLTFEIKPISEKFLWPGGWHDIHESINNFEYTSCAGYKAKCNTAHVHTQSLQYGSSNTFATYIHSCNIPFEITMKINQEYIKMCNDTSTRQLLGNGALGIIRIGHIDSGTYILTANGMYVSFTGWTTLPEDDPEFGYTKNTGDPISNAYVFQTIINTGIHCCAAKIRYKDLPRLLYLSNSQINVANYYCWTYSEDGSELVQTDECWALVSAHINGSFSELPNFHTVHKDGTISTQYGNFLQAFDPQFNWLTNGEFDGTSMGLCDFQGTAKETLAKYNNSLNYYDIYMSYPNYVPNNICMGIKRARDMIAPYWSGILRCGNTWPNCGMYTNNGYFQNIQLQGPRQQYIACCVSELTNGWGIFKDNDGTLGIYENDNLVASYKTSGKITVRKLSCHCGLIRMHIQDGDTDVVPDSYYDSSLTDVYSIFGIDKDMYPIDAIDISCCNGFGVFRYHGKPTYVYNSGTGKNPLRADIGESVPEVTEENIDEFINAPGCTTCTLDDGLTKAVAVYTHIDHSCRGNISRYHWISEWVCKCADGLRRVQSNFQPTGISNTNIVNHWFPIHMNNPKRLAVVYRITINRRFGGMIMKDNDLQNGYTCNFFEQFRYKGLYAFSTIGSEHQAFESSWNDINSVRYCEDGPATITKTSTLGAIQNPQLVPNKSTIKNNAFEHLEIKQHFDSDTKVPQKGALTSGEWLGQLSVLGQSTVTQKNDPYIHDENNSRYMLEFNGRFNKDYEGNQSPNKYLTITGDYDCIQPFNKIAGFSEMYFTKNRLVEDLRIDRLPQWDGEKYKFFNQTRSVFSENGVLWVLDRDLGVVKFNAYGMRLDDESL